MRGKSDIHSTAGDLTNDGWLVSFPFVVMLLCCVRMVMLYLAMVASGYFVGTSTGELKVTR